MEKSFSSSESFKKIYSTSKLIYWNLTGWEIQERLRACASVSYRLSLKYKDTKRATNWIPNLDDPCADVVTTVHPRWRLGLVPAERAASWGAGPCQPGHRAMQTQVGARVRWESSTGSARQRGHRPAFPCTAPRRAPSAAIADRGRSCLFRVLLSTGDSPQLAREKQLRELSLHQCEL